MNVVITNTGPVSMPLTSKDAGGLAAELAPGSPYTLSRTDVSVVVFGDNPSFIDDLKRFLGDAAELIGRLIAFWREHHERSGEEGDPVATCTITNNGPNALRVLQGDDRNLDTEVAAGATFEASGVFYVELRELGV